MAPTHMTLMSRDATIDVPVLDTPVAFDITEAPGLSLTVPDASRRLSDYSVGLLGDEKTDLVATVYGHPWRVTETAHQRDQVTFTLEHRGAWGMRNLRGPISAPDGMSRPQFATLLWSASRAGRKGDALYTPLVNPEAAGYKPPVLKAETRKGDRDAQKKRDTQLAAGFKPGASFKIKSETADGEQKRVLASALSVADDMKAPRLAKLALVCALIVESQCRNLTYGDRDSTGVLQVRAGTARDVGVDPRNIEQVVRKFLSEGYWKYRPEGAIKQARKYPSLSAGDIAQRCQGSDPNEYQTYLNEARAILAAWSGGDAGDLTGASEPESTLQLGDGEDGWTGFKRLGTESRRRAYPTLERLVFATDNQHENSRPLLVVERGAHRYGIKSIGEWKADANRQVDTFPFELICSDETAWRLAGHTVEVRGEGDANGIWLVSKFNRASRKDRHVSFEAERLRSFLPESKIARATARASSGSASTARSRDQTSAGLRGGASPVQRLKPSGSYAGTKSVFDQFIHPFMRRKGLSAGSQKRPTRGTATGGVSDHWEGSTTAYATDYPTTSGEAAARALAREFGWTSWQPNSYTTFTVTIGNRKFRLQILWGSGVAHGDHVHVGLKAI